MSGGGLAAGAEARGAAPPLRRALADKGPGAGERGSSLQAPWGNRQLGGGRGSSRGAGVGEGEGEGGSSGSRPRCSLHHSRNPAGHSRSQGGGAEEGGQRVGGGRFRPGGPQQLAMPWSLKHGGLSPCCRHCCCQGLPGAADHSMAHRPHQPTTTLLPASPPAPWLTCRRRCHWPAPPGPPGWTAAAPAPQAAPRTCTQHASKAACRSRP
ncbi:hypothetical protein V8C86DRAFT_1068862 [Haematococcus lacustris]